jgi:hypothetical protein
MTNNLSDAETARHVARSVIRRAELTWTVDLVEQRLSQAARGIERYVSRPGPSGKTGFWPQVVQNMQETLSGMSLSEVERFQREQNQQSSHRHVLSAEREIRDMEEAIYWPARYLAAREKELKAMKIWLYCKARNQPWERCYAELGCSRRTAFRRRDRALQLILEGLIADEVLP